jgi:hypothetical protein
MSSQKHTQNNKHAVTTATASLSESQQVISGTAVGIGDTTKGLSDDLKRWGEDELREAADSLAGGDVKLLHSDTKIGTVTDSGFVEDKGVVYEAEIDDSEIAESIQNGRLTVSVEARHSDGGTIDTERGDAMVVDDIEFSDLAVVQVGAAPSASANPGEAAALSPAELRALLEETMIPHRRRAMHRTSILTTQQKPRLKIRSKNTTTKLNHRTKRSH